MAETFLQSGDLEAARFYAGLALKGMLVLQGASIILHPKNYWMRWIVKK
jgi:hypothetical protein